MTDSTRRILERLGLPTESPRLVHARDPTTLDGEEPDAAHGCRGEASLGRSLATA